MDLYVKNSFVSYFIYWSRLSFVILHFLRTIAQKYLQVKQTTAMRVISTKHKVDDPLT